VSYGKATPYFPVIDLLKHYCHVDDGDEARTIRAKVTGQVLTLDETLQETLPALLALLDAVPADSPFLQLDPPQRRQRTLDGLKRLLLRESQVQPLLLVFEDLHWLDTETQALLDRLVESLPTTRLLLLVNYRPEYQHGWGSKTYYTQLRLDPLPPASAGEFLQALLGDDPSLAPLKQLLIARTEGNPFFLEESVRTLVETEVLVGATGAYRLLKPLQGMPVPATVQAVLAARIDRLAPEEKHLLQTAAVIGTEVPLPLLRAIAELPEEAFYRSLAHVQAAEFLYETRLFPGQEYTFKHALTHEVAYNSLLLERRRVLHAKIVEALEALYPDRLAEYAERLAQHTFRGEVWDKAVAYGRQAGTRALARSALREAVACFEQALAALKHLPESRATQEQAIDLRFDLRNALLTLGETRRMLDYLREAATLAETLADQPRLGRVSAYMCRYFTAAGDHDSAVESGQHALAMAATLGDFTLQVMAQHALGVAYHALGDQRRAMELLRSNVESLAGALSRQRFGSLSLPAVISRAGLARCLAEMGAFSEGSAHAEEAVRLAEAVEHPNSLIQAYLGVGFLSLRQKDLARAILVLERCLDLCGVYYIRARFPEAAAALGCAYALAGRVAEALPLLKQTEQVDTALGTMGSQSLRLGYVSEAYLLAGRMQEAVQLAGRALDLSRAHKERGYQAWALRLLGEITAHQNPLEVAPAESHYRQALALADELGMRPLVAHCHLGLGTLYRQTGRVEPARAELSIAVELYRAMDMTFWLPQAETALAEAEG
jgi:tetratricopeptide (TPR) repeat protein